MSVLSFLRPSFEKGIGRARAENGTIVDVRTREEFAQGHIEGAVNIPLQQLPNSALPKAEKLFVYCLSGSRSAQAVSWLKSRGVEAINIGGIAGYRGKLAKGE